MIKLQKHFTFLLACVSIATASSVIKAGDIDIMSYNIFMLPYANSVHKIIEAANYLGVDPASTSTGRKLLKIDNNAKKRAKNIPPQIAPLADVFALQEGFDGGARNVLVNNMTSAGVKNNSGILERSKLKSWRATNSGLITMSKPPMDKVKGRYYQDQGIESYGEEKYADKGVLYTRIVKNGKPYHIFNTHLQSKSGGRKIREDQIKYINKFMLKRNIPKNEPVIIVGDFNIDRLNHEQRPEQVEQYKMLFKNLDVTEVVPKEGDVEFTSLFSKRQAEKIGGTGKELPKGQAIDHVFYSNKHLKPTDAWLTVEQQKPLGDLSDHFPIVAHFKFKGY